MTVAKYWIDIKVKEGMARETEELLRAGRSPPSWWFPVLRDFYEYKRKLAYAAGDKVSARHFRSRQIAFSVLAKRTLPAADIEPHPSRLRLAKNTSNKP